MVIDLNDRTIQMDDENVDENVEFFDIVNKISNCNWGGNWGGNWMAIGVAIGGVVIGGW